MGLYSYLSSRQALRKIFGWPSSIAFPYLLALLMTSSLRAKARPTHGRFVVEDIGAHRPYSVKELVRQVLQAPGEMHGFVSKDDVVAIKPNVSWATSPELADTTNPEVLKAIAELCYEAGAKKVKRKDRSPHLDRSGIYRQRQIPALIW